MTLIEYFQILICMINIILILYMVQEKKLILAENRQQRMIIEALSLALNNIKNQGGLK